MGLEHSGAAGGAAGEEAKSRKERCQAYHPSFVRLGVHGGRDSLGGVNSMYLSRHFFLQYGVIYPQIIQALIHKRQFQKI